MKRADSTNIVIDGKESSIDDFLEYIRACRGASPHTIRAYRRAIESFARFIAADGLEPDEATRSDVRAFIRELTLRGLSARSVNQNSAALRSFFRYLLRLGRIPTNPVAYLRPQREGRKLPVIMSEEETACFLEIQGATFQELRDRALFEVLYSTGCRVSEIVGANMSDLEPNHSMKVRGKGGRERFVFLGLPAQEALQRYLWARKERLARPGKGVARNRTDAAEALFISWHNRRRHSRHLGIAGPRETE